MSYRLVRRYWWKNCPRYGSPYLEDSGYYLVLQRVVSFFRMPIVIWERRLCEIPSWEMIRQGTLGDPAPTVVRWTRKLRAMKLIS